MTAPVEGQRYTAAQIRAFAQSGWRFRDVTTLDDTEPMYVVTEYAGPPRGLDPRNGPDWMHGDLCLICGGPSPCRCNNMEGLG